MASSKKGKKSPKVKDLKSKKVSPSKASQVKGGFNPQPDPPGRLTNLTDKWTPTTSLKTSPINPIF